MSLRAIPFLVALIAALACASSAIADPNPRCFEDEPCWRWSTMGDLQRGVVLNTPKGEPKRRAVLDPCEFGFYDHMGWIDWQRTPRLRGDAFARRHGCDPRYFA